jgi:LacI family transcriptional regulator
MNSVAPVSRAERKQIACSDIPVVLLSRAPEERNFSSVTCDNEHGGYLAGTYLAGLGHTVVAHLTGVAHHPNLEKRRCGFTKGFERITHGRKPVLLRGAHNGYGGFAMTERLLKEHPGVTAIFAGNDAIALGCARALYAAGIRIPDDMSLIGFDDIEQASIMHPPLTTISQPIYEIGRAAVEILIDQFNRKDCTPEHRRFDVRLIERDSCRGLHVPEAAVSM